MLKNLRCSVARRSRKQIVLVLLLVLVLDCPISDYEDEKDDEDEGFARPATIWPDTDRLQVCATGAASTLNRYPSGRQTFCPRDAGSMSSAIRIRPLGPAHGILDQFGGGGEIEFLFNLFTVMLDGLDAEMKCARDLAGGLPLAD